jgi:hypothetical protein
MQRMDLHIAFTASPEALAALACLVTAVVRLLKRQKRE